MTAGAWSDRVRGRHGVAALRPREREVLALYPEFGSYRLIAEELGLSIQTVKNYGYDATRVLDAISFGQAAVLYDRTQRHG